MVQSAKIGERKGQRTVLLWVLWIVMTLLLLAAGVAVLGGEVPAPARTGAGAVPVVGLSPVAAQDATAAPVAGETARQLVAAGRGNDVAVRARVRLRLDLGEGQTVPWPHGVHVGVAAFGAGADPAGRGDWLGQEPPPVPWTFAVPAGTARLRFQANGFAVETVAMPVAEDGIADLGNLTLRAEAAIRLRLLHVPAALRAGAVATVHIGCYGNARLAAVPLTWRGDCGEARLPALTGCALTLHVHEICLQK